jgi:steroid Delta-isomerase
MPTSDQIRTVVKAYVESFNRKDRDQFLGLFADDVQQIDPVGSPANVGKDALAAFWDTLYSSWSTVDFAIRDLFVTGDEAALVFHITQSAPGAGADVDGVDVFQVNDVGKIRLIKGYSDADHIKLRDDA